MKKLIANCFQYLGGIILVFFGLYGIFLGYVTNYKLMGPISLFFSTILLQVTLFISPWIALIKWGEWWSLFVVYVLGALSMLFFTIGDFLTSQRSKSSAKIKK